MKNYLWGKLNIDLNSDDEVRGVTYTVFIISFLDVPGFEAPKPSKRHPVQRWIEQSFTPKEEEACKYDNTKWWEYVVGSSKDADIILKPQA